jgi:hypothetical protein
MIKLICDICEMEVEEIVKIRFCDGEHPHGGSTMHTTKDVCWECVKKLDRIDLAVEFSDCYDGVRKKRFRELV